MLTAYAAAVTTVADDSANQLAGLIKFVGTKIPLWISAFVVILLSALIAKIARSMVENKMAERGIEEEHKEVMILGGRMTYAVILVIGITAALKIAGIDLTPIIAAGAFGIGFALKDLIMNFLAGIMILISRHFTIGDFINVGGTVGRVVEIQSRNTVLQAIDGTKVIVPNSDLFQNKVVNFTSNPFRRIEVEVGVDYRANLENALKLCLETTQKTKGVLLEPKPAVLISEWGDSEIVIKVRAWVDSRGGWLKIKSHLLLNLKNAFDEYNIDIAWPIVQLAYDKEQEHNAEKMFEVKQSKKKVEVTSRITVPAVAQVPGATAGLVSGTTPTLVAIPVVIPQDIDLDDGQPLKPLAEQ